MRSDDGLVESYRNLTETLVGTLAHLAPKGKRFAFMLKQVAEQGFHEGTDEAVSDFARQASPTGRLMRLVAAEHRRAVQAGHSDGAR